MPEPEVLALEEHQEATAGDPGALGLFGFAVGTLVIAFVLSGLVGQSHSIATVPTVLVFAGVAQFIAGMWAFRKGNTFAGTAFAVYGANNTLIAMFLWMQHGGTIGMTSADLKLSAVELFCFAYISLVLGFAALKLNATFVTILWLLVPGFGLVGVHQAGGALSIGHLGGYFLMASAAFAFYGASAIVVNSVWGRTVLPMISLRGRERVPALNP
jgi:succinate-acetate transporter protein